MLFVFNSSVGSVSEFADLIGNISTLLSDPDNDDSTSLPVIRDLFLQHEMALFVANKWDAAIIAGANEIPKTEAAFTKIIQSKWFPSNTSPTIELLKMEALDAFNAFVADMPEPKSFRICK